MAKPPAPSDIADKFMLRMPDGMRDRIAEAARDNNRSMNAEIVSRLQASLDEVPRVSTILTPEGVEAMRSYAETTTRMLMELKAVTAEAGKHALTIIAEREALEAARGERETLPTEPDSGRS